VTDRRGHRVVEVTPRGEVVWEFYAPWQPYDAERVGTAPGSDGPTMRQLRAGGTHRMRGSADYDTARIERCDGYLTGWENGSRLVPEDELRASTGTEGSESGFEAGENGGTEPVLTTVPPGGTTAIDASLPLAGAAFVALVLAGVGLRRRGLQ